MGKAIGMSSRGLARYVQTGEATPKYSLLEKAAKVVFGSVDEIRMDVLGDLYVDGEWHSFDDADFDRDKLLKVIARLAAHAGADLSDDPAADLDDL